MYTRTNLSTARGKINLGTLSNKTFLKTCALSLLSALVIVFLSFAIGGFAPFGNRSLTYNDGEFQVIDLLCWLKDVLSGKSSIDYTFTKQLGGSNFAVFSYYLASPLNLLVIFFDKSQMPLFMNLLFIFKVALSSIFTDYYLCRRFRPESKSKCALTVLLSVSYALCQYMVTQSSMIMWLDGAYMLPLILAGIEKLVGEKKSTLFIVSAALSICFNWYTGAINIMFACFWFLFESARLAITDTGNSRMTLKSFGFSILRLALAGISAVMISAVILLPTLMLLSGRTYGKGGISMLLDFGFIGFLPNIISNYSLGTPSVKGSANVFAGSLVLIGVVLLFLATSKSIKEKLLYGAFLLFVCLSFYWQPLVAVFSIFRSVGAYWYRYGYIGSFTMVVLASVFFLESDHKKLKSWMPIAISLIYSLLTLVISILKLSSSPDILMSLQIADLLYVEPDFTIMPILAKIITPLIVSVLLAVALSSNGKKSEGPRLISILISVILIVECLFSQILLSHLYSEDNVSQIASYTNLENSLVQEINDPSFHRMVQTSCHSLFRDLPTSYNEPMAFGFNSVTSFVSAPDENSVFFLDRAGYGQAYYTVTVTSSDNLALDSLMSVKYVLLPSNADYGNGLQYMDGIEGFKNLYLNPYSVPIAFVTDKTGDFESSETNPSLYLNDIYRYLSDVENDVLIPIEADNFTYEEFQAASEEISEPSYAYHYSITCEPDSILYANFITDTDSGAKIYLNDELLTAYSNEVSPSMIRIPVPNGTADIKLVFKDNSSEHQVLDAQFCTLNLEALEQATDVLKNNAADRIDVTDGHCVFEIDGASAQSSLFTSIPANKGWTVTRNGEEVDYNLIGDCLISIPLTEGNNVIEMTYRLPYKTAGIVLAISGVVLLAGITFAENRKKPEASLNP